MLSGGVFPGGIVLRRVWLMAVTSASADPMFASGWKKTRIRPTPASDCDSMCSMLLTVVVIARSEMVTMRPSTSFGESPLNCQMIEMTGMLISGKMSTGVRAMVSTPPMAMSSAITMNVYGRRRARRTIHIAQPTAPLSSRMPPGRRNSHAGGVRSLPLLDSSRFKASAPKLAGSCRGGPAGISARVPRCRQRHAGSSVVATGFLTHLGWNWFRRRRGARHQAGAVRLSGARLKVRVTKIALDAVKLSDAGIAASELAVDVNAGYLGGGYSVVGDLEHDAIRSVAQMEGLLLDPVYTGRAMGGLIDLIRRGAFAKTQSILFWHTGGTAALSAFADKL